MVFSALTRGKRVPTCGIIYIHDPRADPEACSGLLLTCCAGPAEVCMLRSRDASLNPSCNQAAALIRTLPVRPRAPCKKLCHSRSLFPVLFLCEALEMHLVPPWIFRCPSSKPRVENSSDRCQRGVIMRRIDTVTAEPENGRSVLSSKILHKSGIISLSRANATFLSVMQQN